MKYLLIIFTFALRQISADMWFPNPSYNSGVRKSYFGWNSPKGYTNYGPPRQGHNHYYHHGRGNSLSHSHGQQTILVYHQAATGGSRLSNNMRRPFQRYANTSPQRRISNGQHVQIIKIVNEGPPPHEYASRNNNYPTASPYGASPQLKTIRLVPESTIDWPERNNQVDSLAYGYQQLPETTHSDTPYSNINVEYEPTSGYPNANAKYGSKSASDLESVKQKILQVIASTSDSSSSDIDLGSIELSGPSGAGQNAPARGLSSVVADSGVEDFRYDHGNSNNNDDGGSANWW